MKDYKTAILPIVMVICLGIASVTGHTISTSLQDQVSTWAATLIGVGISIWGVIKSHKKEGTK